MPNIKILIVAASLLYTADVTPEQTQTEQWQQWVMGAPGSTKTDIEEGTSILILKRKPSWGRK